MSGASDVRDVIGRPVLTGGGSLRVPMSYAEFVSLGETKSHEYYEGLCVVNPPSRVHDIVKGELVALLRSVCPPTHRVHQEWGWQTGTEGPVFIPDAMVVVRAIADVDVLRSTAPVVVVEVLSPSTRDVDLGVKARAYAAAGAAWYWVFDLDAVELMVLENRTGVFVEVQRIVSAEPAITVGPFAARVDPAAIVSA